MLRMDYRSFGYSKRLLVCLQHRAKGKALYVLAHRSSKLER